MTGDYDLPEMECPACQAKLDAAMGVGQSHAPERNDYSVCFYCGAGLIFVTEQEVRQMTKEECLATERLNPEFAQVRFAILYEREMNR